MAEREIRLSEVKNHNKDDDVWIIIHNNVYNVTAFLNEHPAGPEILIEQAGKDASQPFDDAGHSDDAKKLMLKYKIGKIAKEDLPGYSQYIKNFAIAALVGLIVGIIMKNRLRGLASLFPSKMD